MTNGYIKEVGSRVKEVRQMLKLSVNKFRPDGMSEGVVENIERGRTINLNELAINLICEKHNINKDYVLNGEGEMFKPKKKRPDDLMGLIGDLDDDIVDGTGKHSEFKEWLVIKTLKMSDDQLDVLKELLLDFSSNEIEGLDKKKYED